MASFYRSYTALRRALQALFIAFFLSHGSHQCPLLLSQFACPHVAAVVWKE